MKHFYKSLGENWFTYPQLYSQMVQRFGDCALFVEVGTWKGMSAAYMAVEIINSGKRIDMHCVDSWAYLPTQREIKAEKFVDLYQIFLTNIEPVKQVITPVQAISWEAAERYADESCDFVFIDAAHDYTSVIKDLQAWYPKVKTGGVFAGHDYAWGVDVKRAVDEFMDGRPIRQQEGCWIFDK